MAVSLLIIEFPLDVGDDDRGKQSKDDSTNKEVNS